MAISLAKLLSINPLQSTIFFRNELHITPHDLFNRILYRVMDIKIFSINNRLSIRKTIIIIIKKKLSSIFIQLKKERERQRFKKLKNLLVILVLNIHVSTKRHVALLSSNNNEIQRRYRTNSLTNTSTIINYNDQRISLEQIL